MIYLNPKPLILVVILDEIGCRPHGNFPQKLIARAKSKTKYRQFFICVSGDGGESGVLDGEV